MNIVFLHITNPKDPESLIPTYFVKSVKKFCENPNIIQVTDKETKAISGVNEVVRIGGDIQKIMVFRLNAFYELKLYKQTFYMDTDMIFIKKFKIKNVFNEDKIVLLERNFMNNAMLNVKFNDMDLTEYAGKTLGEVYPYIACFSCVSDPMFWKDCLNNLKKLDDKFHYWYGDQEAIRNIAKSNKYKIQEVPEKIYACPPRFIDENTDACIIHFKGSQNKDLIESYFKYYKIEQL